MVFLRKIHLLLNLLSYLAIVASANLAYGQKFVEVTLKPAKISTELTLACRVHADKVQNLLIQEAHTMIRTVLKNEGDEVKVDENIALSSENEIKKNLIDKNDERIAAVKAVADAELEKKNLEKDYNAKKELAKNNMVAANELRSMLLPIEMKKLDIRRAQSDLFRIETELSELRATSSSSAYKAKIDGIVSFILGEKDIIRGFISANPDDLLATIQSKNNYHLTCMALDTQIQKLKLRQEGLFSLEGLSEKKPCQVSNIDPIKKDGEFGFFNVKCSFSENTLLRIGLLATLTFKFDEMLVENTLPWNAIQQSNQGYYVLKPSNQATVGPIKQPVKIGRQGTFNVEITEGLKEGENIFANLW